MNSQRSVAGFSPDRASGVLLHPTSIPGGNLGSGALRFIDWLSSAGQHWWQVLPLGPPDRYRSPYASRSAFAGSPHLLARPSAKVTISELEGFIARQRYWAGGWAHSAGRGALEDQVRFEREWSQLRRHAIDRGISILGDIPIYVARDSADHVEHRALFDDSQSAGVPPDDWSMTGQLWNSPVYDWRAMQRDGYRWWIERFRRMFELVDAVRIDHFRGFVAFWSVPSSHTTAEVGIWRKGPGRRLFDAVRDELGTLNLIAENLGLVTPAVEHLRQQLHIPGTVVLQFSFSESMINGQPIRHSHDDVVYTGTHDNDTSFGWWQHVGEHGHANVNRALEVAGIVESQPHWKLIRLALHHEANLCIIPAQDLVGLGSSARMNFPGRTRGNWQWQLEPGMLSSELARRMRDETLAASR